jgi:N-acetylornithine carbamoyltransferase
MSKLKHFLTTLDYSQVELNEIIKLALSLKNGDADGAVHEKILGMLFFNPSLRTRLSFAAGMYKLGGTAIDLPVGSAYTFEFQEGAIMNEDTIEHIKEAVPTMSRYCDAIAVRSSDLITSSKESVDVLSWSELKKDTVLQGFAKHATVPVINMESNVWHPCQGVGDAMTLVEKFKNPKNKKYVLTWAYHPKALPMATPNSQILAACDLGMDVVVAHPEGWELDPEIVKLMGDRAEQAGGALEFANSQESAFQDADVICAKSWGALQYYGNWEQEKKIRDNLKHWIVDKEKMQLTSNALFMHCLPVRRNVEVASAVLDSPNSIVIDEAENRMWAQMAILIKILSERQS